MSALSGTAKAANIEHRPEIVLRERDYQTLCEIAFDAMLRTPRLAGGLLEELHRAHVRSDREVPDEVAGIGSSVTYQDEASGKRQVELVTPLHEQVDEGRVSVLSNLGAALVGLRPGDEILWRDRVGGARRLTILNVFTRSDRERR